MRSLLQPALDLAVALAPHALALLRQLAQAAVMGTLFVLAVWVLCRLAPRLPAGVRCALWWLASLKLLLGLVWPAPLALPLLPPTSSQSAAAGLARWFAPEQAAERASLPAPSLAAVAAHNLAGASIPARIPVPAGTAPLSPAAAGQSLGGAAASARTSTPAPRSRAGAARPSAAHRPGISAAAAVPWWALALAAVWIAGLLRQIGLLATELRRVRRFLRRSAPVQDESVLRLAGELGRALELPPVELRAAPSVAELAAPLTAGALRPVVVLPAAGLDRLSRQELAMTLGHELMHVRRRDLLWGWLPAAAARLFFFLPPAALAAREYALAREAACDAAVVRLLGAAPASYGRLLVRLGARGPAAWAQAGLPDLSPASVASAGAASSLHQLKRRLEMLQHHSQPRSTRPAPLRRLGFCLLALLAAAALLPLRIVAAAPAVASATTLSLASTRLSVPYPALRAMVAALLGHRDFTAFESGAAAKTDAVESMGEASSMIPPEPPEPPEAPETPEPPEPPQPPDAPQAPPMNHAHDHLAGHFHMHSNGRTHGDVYVLLHGQHDIMVSGSTEDVDRTRGLQRKTGGGDVLWTRRNGREYMIRDAATLQAVRDLFRPQAELGDQQGKLGDQQGTLGDKQGEIGDRQGELGDRQGALGDEQARLASEEATLAAEESSGDGRASEAREKRREELAEARRKLAREMRALGGQQRELGKKQRELGKRQSELGRRQSALGREQERAAREAEAKLHALLDQAIANGTAKEVK